MFCCDRFICCFYLLYFFVETDNISSNDGKDIFGNAYPMLLMKQEENLFAVSPGISGDFKNNTDYPKLELNTEEDEGMLQIFWSSIFLGAKNEKLYLQLKLWRAEKTGIYCI